MRVANGVKVAAYELSQTNLSYKQDADCVSYDLGVKACGGPLGYIVVSVNNKHNSAIKKLAEMSVQKEAEINDKYGLISDCMMLMPSRDELSRKSVHCSIASQQ